MQINSIGVQNQNFKGLNTKKCELFADAIKNSKAIQEVSKKYNVRAFEITKRAPMNDYSYNVVMEISTKMKNIFKKPKKAIVNIQSMDSINFTKVSDAIKNLDAAKIDNAVKNESILTKIVSKGKKLTETIQQGRAQTIYQDMCNKQPNKKPIKLTFDWLKEVTK